MKIQKSDNSYFTTKILTARLDGAVLYRKTLEDMDIHKKKASLRSFISTLRNERYISIESETCHNGTCNYYMLPEEIKRYHDPIEREIQIEEMKELKRQRAVKKGFNQ